MLPPFVVVAILFVAWLWMAVFAAKRWLGYQWCMLVTGLVIAIAAGVAYDYALVNIIIDGTMMYASTILTFAFACIFARACLECGIIESMIKKTIELGGGRPFLTVCAITAVWAPISANVPGLPGVIVVGSLTLPVMLAMGIKADVAGRIHMLGTTIAIPYWTVYWVAFGNIAGGLYPGDYQPMLMMMVAVATIFVYAWIFFKFKREGLPIRWAAKNESREKKTEEMIEAAEKFAKAPPSFIPEELAPRPKMAPWYSYIAVLLPILIIAGLNVNPLVVFTSCILFALILSHPGSGRKLRDYFPLTERITYEGFKDVAPIAINLAAVGWLVKAGGFPEVIDAWANSVGTLIPTGFSIGAVIILVLMMPFALFRGPGHAFGLGALTMGALVAIGVPPLLTLTFLYAEMIFMVSTCPTYAYIVWAYGYVGEPPIRALDKVDTPWFLIMGYVAFFVGIAMYYGVLVG